MNDTGQFIIKCCLLGRIRLRRQIRIIFKVQDIANAQRIDVDWQEGKMYNRALLLTELTRYRIKSDLPVETNTRLYMQQSS